MCEWSVHVPSLKVWKTARFFTFFIPIISLRRRSEMIGMKKVKNRAVFQTFKEGTCTLHSHIVPADMRHPKLGRIRFETPNLPVQPTQSMMLPVRSEERRVG